MGSSLRRLIYKMRHYEYWPFNVFYFPVFFYFIYLCIRHRSFFFFTASNPTIEFGGMLGEQKSKIFDLIPDETIPKTKLFGCSVQVQEVMDWMNQSDLRFPVILKPDIGERGWMVEAIKSKEELSRYITRIRVDFLVQEFIDLPVELGVFYVRLPDESKGKVTSVVQKAFLSVKGDGRSTVKELLGRSTRAMLNFNFNSDYYQGLLASIPKDGEAVLVEGVGNHSRGTTFLNANHEIDTNLQAVFDDLAKRIPDFYFGRFDLRCASFEELKKGKSFKILELNGAGAEQGHVYQPGYGIWNAYRDIIAHLRLLGEVSSQNKKRGVRYWSFSEGIVKMREIRSYNRLK